jgi:hypothetical protein
VVWRLWSEPPNLVQTGSGIRLDLPALCPEQAGAKLAALVGLVELCDGLGSDQLFGCDVEAVGAALDRLQLKTRNLR